MQYLAMMDREATMHINLEEQKKHYKKEKKRGLKNGLHCVELMHNAHTQKMKQLRS